MARDEGILERHGSECSTLAPYAPDALFNLSQCINSAVRCIAGGKFLERDARLNNGPGRSEERLDLCRVALVSAIGSEIASIRFKSVLRRGKS